jgi:hypothetical protein
LILSASRSPNSDGAIFKRGYPEVGHSVPDDSAGFLLIDLVLRRHVRAKQVSVTFMPTIAILEDDPRRITAMLAACRASFPELGLEIFGSAPAMIT